MKPEVSALAGASTGCLSPEEVADGEGRLQDVEDYQNATTEAKHERPKAWWKCIGTGLVTGAATILKTVAILVLIAFPTAYLPAFGQNLQGANLLLTSLRQDSTAPPDGTQKKAPAASEKPKKDAAFEFQAETTFILQNLFAFHSAYSGANSFRSRNEMELSDTYEIFLGARVAKNVEVYVDPEIAWGNGLSHGLGLAAYPNGDIMGQPTLRPDPFLARYFVRWRIPMPHIGSHPGGESTDTESYWQSAKHHACNVSGPQNSDAGGQIRCERRI